MQAQALQRRPVAGILSASICVSCQGAAKQLAEAQRACEELRSKLSALKEDSVSGVLPSQTGSRLCGICSIHVTNRIFLDQTAHMSDLRMLLSLTGNIRIYFLELNQPFKSYFCMHR